MVFKSCWLQESTHMDDCLIGSLGCSSFYCMCFPRRMHDNDARKTQGDFEIACVLHVANCMSRWFCTDSFVSLATSRALTQKPSLYIDGSFFRPQDLAAGCWPCQEAGITSFSCQIVISWQRSQLFVIWCFTYPEDTSFYSSHMSDVMLLQSGYGSIFGVQYFWHKNCLLSQTDVQDFTSPAAFWLQLGSGAMAHKSNPYKKVS